MNWLKTLQSLLQEQQAAVMVTVASIVGSTPREPGARMIVTAERIYGSIGGGNLEHQATAIARDQLAASEPGQLRRFPLGAGLGQCCGGLVNLMFEPVVDTDNWVEAAIRLETQGKDWVRALAAKTENCEFSECLLLTADSMVSEPLPGSLTSELVETARSLLAGSEKASQRQLSGSTETWFFELNRQPDFRLFLFGAGHVGRALVNVLRDLPIRIVWVDSREDQFPTELDDNVEYLCSDIPEAEIDAAPAGSYFLVMTHDHALDQCLTEQILKRDDFAYFGLIGSASKRRMFETRMARRGLPRESFERMVCPIGVDGIDSKQPAAIAISVAAELMQVYQRARSASDIDTSPGVELGSAR